MISVSSFSLPNLARSIILGSLKDLKVGELRIVTPEQDVLTFGNTEPNSPSALKATIHVKRPLFWTRLLLSDDLGFAEAYMCGDVDCDDISTLLKLMILNDQHIRAKSRVTSFLSIPRLLTASRFQGDPFTTRANVSAHYDIDNTMFAAFLSPDLNYSTAIFKDIDEDLQDDDSKKWETLEKGQNRKMRNLIYELLIQADHRVLEIGTGWGSLAILAVQLTGCTVVTLTLSSEQKILAEERIKTAGLPDKITVHLMDYRDLRKRVEWKHYFDRFISVEMMEHVGKCFFETYWEIADWALKEEDAVGCVQVTTLPEARVDRYDQGIDFIRKWSMRHYSGWNNSLLILNILFLVFPGCYIPSLTHLISTMSNGTKGRLTIDSVSNIGPHYARTLREWKRNFLRNFERTIAPALIARYNLSDYDAEIFRRKWCCEFLWTPCLAFQTQYIMSSSKPDYFEYCEAGFATRRLGAHIISFTREGNMALGCTWDGYGKIDIDEHCLSSVAH